MTYPAVSANQSVVSLTLTACDAELSVANLTSPISMVLPIPTVSIDEPEHYYGTCNEGGENVTITCNSTGLSTDIECPQNSSGIFWNVTCPVQQLSPACQVSRNHACFCETPKVLPLLCSSFSSVVVKRERQLEHRRMCSRAWNRCDRALRMQSSDVVHRNDWGIIFGFRERLRSGR